MERTLRNELRLLEAGIRRSAQRLQDSEARHGLSTTDFLQRYEENALEETLEFAEWIGEFRLRERLGESRRDASHPICRLKPIFSSFGTLLTPVLWCSPQA